MEFRGEDQNKVDQYSGTKEEEEEEGEEEEEDKEQSEEEEVTVRHINRTTSSDHHHHHQQQQQQHQFPLPSPQGQAAVTMDYLSLGTSNSAWEGEREHMFDKVVTPSDVGKLNRLVIPKQHAEKYFPLDSNSTDKGLLLNFEDRTGKQWRFRYSYWNSSQSYVMTKGWSRFVKDKKLDAGDIVSFQRAPGRLFIDCRRRPNHPHHLFHYHHPIDHHRWGYSIPQAPIIPSPPLLRTLHQDTTFHHYINNNNMVHYPSYNHQYRHHDYVSPILIDSVPVTAMAAPPKRLRLFGVNMEYSPNQEVSSPSSSSSVQLYPHHHHHHHLHQVRIPNNSNPSTIFPLLPTTTTSTSSFPVEFSHKGKSSSNSLSFDLDP